MLTDAASWRLVFFVNVPIGVAALLLTVRYVVRPEGHGRRGLDLGAQVAAVAALGLLTFALIQARTRGWVSPIVLGGLVVAALSAAAFVAVERRSADPMLPLGLFRSAAFSGGNAVGLLINLGFYGQLFVVSLFFRDVRRMSPTLAGLALVPEGILVSLASLAGGRLAAPMAGAGGAVLAGALVVAIFVRSRRAGEARLA
ncbi:hypothetical protein [Actinoallomurus sp. NPDC052274]|uniref:hypothetical protein n=1 Tax=Actinoallomurus sp. NPDC052274 TaxID=3155420 RepID=UPI0034306162